MKKYSPKQYAQALMESLEGTSPNDEGKVLDNFAKVLAENNDLKMFDQIAEEFHKLDLEKKGQKLVEVTSAHPISHGNEQEILAELNRLAKGKVEIKKKIDEGLIGGVLIKMDDQILDASIKSQLEQLKNELTRS